MRPPNYKLRSALSVGDYGDNSDDDTVCFDIRPRLSLCVVASALLIDTWLHIHLCLDSSLTLEKAPSTPRTNPNTHDLVWIRPFCQSGNSERFFCSLLMHPVGIAVDVIVIVIIIVTIVTMRTIKVIKVKIEIEIETPHKFNHPTLPWKIT